MDESFSYGKQCLVDAIDAGRENAELAPFLAAVRKEFAGVPEGVALDDFAQDSLGRYRRAIRCDDQRNFALGHNRHRHLEDAVLPAEVSEMQARWKRIGLVARFPASAINRSGDKEREPSFFTTTPSWRSRINTAPSTSGSRTTSDNTMKTAHANCVSVGIPNMNIVFVPISDVAGHRGFRPKIAGFESSAPDAFRPAAHSACFTFG